jgi:hypothetical protein
MHKVDSSGATGANEFTNGNPGLGIPRTRLEAKYMNALMYEAVNVVVNSGQTLTDTDNTQLIQAVPFSVATVAALRACPVPNVPDGKIVTAFARGNTSDGDGGVGAGMYRWVYNSSATDDGVNVVRPSTNPSLGRWLRCYQSSLETPGAVTAFARSTAPTGWLKANGALVSRTTYAQLFAAIGTTFGVGDGSTTFALPDLRAEFIRGLDDGRGVDTARALGSSQNQSMEQHAHYGLTFDGSSNDNGDPGDFILTAAIDPNGTQSNPGALTGTTGGGLETRPRNVALLYCIKY